MVGRKKILLAEDDVFILDIYQEKLKNEGYEVVTAENGLKVLERLEEGLPDLIMMDITMPRMNGLEVLHKIRESEVWKNIPVIMITNLSEKEKIQEAQQELVADYLVKAHFTPGEVLEKVRALLDRQNLV